MQLSYNQLNIVLLNSNVLLTFLRERLGSAVFHGRTGIPTFLLNLLECLVVPIEF